MNSNTPASNKWWILVAIGIGTFMSALDGSVVNTILPLIGRSFNNDIATLEWIVTVYLLVLSGLLLSFGRLGDLHGHRSVYLNGLIIFLISSAACGFAINVYMLIIFRSIQALGAAMLAANSPAILTKNFPASQRGQTLGLQATMTYLGLTIGPSIGGWLAEHFSWRMVFYINVPIGLIAILISLRNIPADRGEAQEGRFDLVGAGLFLAGLVTLLIGLNQAHSLGWTSIPIMLLLGSGIIFILLFVSHESRSISPMLDLNLFSSRGFSIAVTSAVINYLCVYVILFLTPFYMIQGRQYNPAFVGLVLTTMPITMAVVAPISGTLSDRIGTRLLTSIGMLFLATGLFLLSRIGPSTSTSIIALSLSISGLGIGIFISPNTSALMGSAPRKRQGIAAGVLATSRNVGMVFGVGLAGAILTSIIASYGQYKLTGLYAGIQSSFMTAGFIALLGFIITTMKPPGSTQPTEIVTSNTER